MLLLIVKFDIEKISLWKSLIMKPLKFDKWKCLKNVEKYLKMLKILEKRSSFISYIIKQLCYLLWRTWSFWFLSIWHHQMSSFNKGEFAYWTWQTSPKNIILFPIRILQLVLNVFWYLFFVIWYHNFCFKTVGINIMTFLFW